MSYIGWPTGVNKIIIDSTTITLGDGVTKTDSLETGKTRSRLLSSMPARKYNVIMDFDWVHQDSDGKSEWDLWREWYERKLKCSQNVFEFPAILYSGSGSLNEWYRISEAVSASKNGEAVRVTMTWETSHENQVTVKADSNLAVDRISVDNSLGKVSAVLVGMPETEPTSNTFIFEVTQDGTELSLVMSGFSYDGGTGIEFYYPKVTESGTYVVSYGGMSYTFVI